MRFSLTGSKLAVSPAPKEWPVARESEQSEEREKEDSNESSKRSLKSTIAQFREWTTGSPLRSAAVGGGSLLLIIATVATWLYLASLAVTPHVPKLADALKAYDQGEYEPARLLIAQMTEPGNIGEEELGGPLFVLGAVKAAQAEEQWSVQHRQSQYLIAAKYLREAHDIGFPPGREEEGNYLLGRSLIESGDNAAGLESLEEALSQSSSGATALHLTLAKAYLQADPPQQKSALKHLDTAIADPELNSATRTKALLDRIALLTTLNQFNDARLAIQKLPSTDAASMAANLALGRLELAEVRDELPSTTADPDATAQLQKKIAQAIQRLQSIPTSDEASEEAMYLVGDAYRLSGDTTAAIRQFERVRKQYSSSPIGIAASMAEGDLYRVKKNYRLAVAAYRRSLTALDDPRRYRTQLLPLGELRRKILAAHTDFLAADEFEFAATLVEHLMPTFDRTRQLELRAATLSEWASQLLADARQGGGNAAAIRRQARLHFRGAGATFEQLADRQFATRHYPEAVWLSAESYFLGQSYTKAIGQLNAYLKNEPEKQNALALLRLGQSHMALDEVELGIGALEECIELHPQDAAIYRARLDCAKAYRDQDNVHLAEQLLLENLNGSGQSPASPEWRDSLFELGHLLHEAGRHDEAIDRLDEAIDRYENADQARLAMYLIGESNRHAAEKPLAELENAKTVNEREDSTRRAQHHLTEALRYYEKVWSAITSAEEEDDLDKAMLRNCYMLRGAVLFDLGRVENNSPQRFKEAIDAYSNVSTLYQGEPFVLETFVQIANCQRRLNQPRKAKMNIDRALQLLDQMPPDADFLAATNFNRDEWKSLLTQMKDW